MTNLTPISYKVEEFRVIEMKPQQVVDKTTGAISVVTPKCFYVKGSPLLAESDAILYQMNKQSSRIFVHLTLFLNDIATQDAFAKLHAEGKFTQFQAVTADIPVPKHYRFWGPQGDREGKNANSIIATNGIPSEFTSIRVSTLFVAGQPNEDLERKAMRIFRLDINEGRAKLADETSANTFMPTDDVTGAATAAPTALTPEQIAAKRQEIEQSLNADRQTLVSTGLAADQVAATINKKRAEMFAAAGIPM